jgi:hypothetical protein
MKVQAAKTRAEDEAEFERQIAELGVKRQAAWEDLQAQTQTELQVWDAELEKLKAGVAAKKAEFSTDYHRQVEVHLIELEAVVRDLRRKATRASLESTLESDRRLAELYNKRRTLREKLYTRK